MEWLIRHLQCGFGLCRRQELPDEAFVETEKAVELVDRRDGCVVVSQAWQSEQHPDCDGVLTRDLLKLSDVAGGSFFGRSSSEALFIDFLCLHQTPRSTNENSLFQKAIKDGMHLIYGNPCWSVWSLTT